MGFVKDFAHEFPHERPHPHKFQLDDRTEGYLITASLRADLHQTLPLKGQWTWPGNKDRGYRRCCARIVHRRTCYEEICLKTLVSTQSSVTKLRGRRRGRNIPLPFTKTLGENTFILFRNLRAQRRMASCRVPHNCSSLMMGNCMGSCGCIGEKILECTPSPESVLQILLQLNFKYSLDGTDPNGVKVKSRASQKVKTKGRLTKNTRSPRHKCCSRSSITVTVTQI